MNTSLLGVISAVIWIHDYLYDPNFSQVALPNKSLNRGPLTLISKPLEFSSSLHEGVDFIQTKIEARHTADSLEA